MTPTKAAISSGGAGFRNIQDYLQEANLYSNKKEGGDVDDQTLEDAAALQLDQKNLSVALGSDPTSPSVAANAE